MVSNLNGNNATASFSSSYLTGTIGYDRSLHLPEIGPRIRLELRFSLGFRATLGQTLE